MTPGRAKELMALGIPASDAAAVGRMIQRHYREDPEGARDVIGTRIPWGPIENFVYASWRHVWRYLGFGVPDWRWLNRVALRRMDRWHEARRAEPNQWEVWIDGDRWTVFDDYEAAERWIDDNEPELTASCRMSWALGARISGSLFRIHGYNRHRR